MDRPTALVAWYYLPGALLGAALLIVWIASPGVSASPATLIVSLALSYSYPVLWLVYRRVTGRRPPGLGDRAARPWSIAQIAIAVGAAGGGWWISSRVGSVWPAWIGVAIIAVAIPSCGGAIESAARHAREVGRDPAGDERAIEHDREPLG